jgi:hypothetical protein
MHPDIVAWMPGLQALIAERGRAGMYVCMCVCVCVFSFTLILTLSLTIVLQVVERRLIKSLQCMVIPRKDAEAAGQLQNTRPIWRPREART